jgi:pimeloyl-ACP methyl ester carboxylesterase
VAVRPTTLRRVPLALAALLDAAGEGGGGVILAGHSAGGDLSIQFAGLFPDRWGATQGLEVWQEQRSP